MHIAPITSNSANNTGVSVGIVSTKILDDNSARKGFFLVNKGAYPVDLTFVAKTGDAPAVANQGSYLAANGGTLNIDLGLLWKGAVYGIAVGGASQVNVVEFL